MRVGQPHHAVRVGDAGERRQQREQQRGLERQVSRVGVDAEDLVPDGRGLVGEHLVELCIAHDLRIVFERLCDLLLL